MNLPELARTILLVNQRPISKVRLARIIYFVHKELIRKKLMKTEDIAYIRSPLGPTPVGYAHLARDVRDLIIQKNISSQLSYTSEEFAINFSDARREEESSALEQYRDVLKAVSRVLKMTNLYATPELVELSHREPSWQGHSNGETYHISPADLKITFPVSANIRVYIRPTPLSNKSGVMQANLLRGMITDIVKESTDLEYPDDPKNSSKPPQPNKKPIFRIKIFRKTPGNHEKSQSSDNHSPQIPPETEHKPNKKGQK